MQGQVVSVDEGRSVGQIKSEDGSLYTFDLASCEVFLWDKVEFSTRKSVAGDVTVMRPEGDPGVELYIYYTKDGKKDWVIADKGSSLKQTLVNSGVDEEGILVFDITDQIK